MCGVVIATRQKSSDGICMQHKHNITMEDVKTMAYLLLGVKFFFLSDSGNFSLLPILKNGGLNFRVMIHRVMPLNSQSVAWSLFTLHFQIHAWNPG